MSNPKKIKELMSSFNLQGKITEQHAQDIERALLDYRNSILDEVEKRLPEKMEHEENETKEMELATSEHNAVLFEVKKALSDLRKEIN